MIPNKLDCMDNDINRSRYEVDMIVSTCPKRGQLSVYTTAIYTDLMMEYWVNSNSHVVWLAKEEWLAEWTVLFCIFSVNISPNYCKHKVPIEFLILLQISVTLYHNKVCSNKMISTFYPARIVQTLTQHIICKWSLRYALINTE